MMNEPLRPEPSQAYAGAQLDDDYEIASILVHARPDRIDAARHELATIAGAQIRNVDARGKLVVVIEAMGAGAIGAMLNAIAALPDVISATLVYHAVET
jgi:nitrate reductase NapD